MSRIGQFVVPDLPHHVTQRGNRGERMFVQPDDYGLYKDWLWITGDYVDTCIFANFYDGLPLWSATPIGRDLQSSGVS
jgi:hypothetical protein